ncbi:DUF169 domain-containing protein [Mailhella massiliensis]|uniref:DUF169 domain-containing protein n=1 Tax=Mailhella massiliensis TaxID=1903261 RepID=A0A921DRF0_9BACT|nr:DUF169 domain-containing protein [Mailhella massiliensis]HJD96951.1 DUF169 domain-containing protein [Mailhella massiliensis]
MADYADMHAFLMRELRLMHEPVGIRFFFEAEELEAFRGRGLHVEPVRPLTFCQAELGARMEGLIVLLDMKKLWCTDARCVFGVDPVSEGVVRDLLRFGKDEAQVRRFVESKPCMKRAPLAVAFSPLRMQEGVPDVVHFCCDNMQAYHLVDDWIAVSDVHPFRPSLSINSAVCGGTAFSFLHGQANMTLACAGSYNSGKMERGEINVMIPGSHMEAVFSRMKERVEKTGGVSLTRSGQPFPGADICQNCPVIVFKKPAERPVK